MLLIGLLKAIKSFASLAGQPEAKQSSPVCSVTTSSTRPSAPWGWKIKRWQTVRASKRLNAVKELPGLVYERVNGKGQGSGLYRAVGNIFVEKNPQETKKMNTWRPSEDDSFPPHDVPLKGAAESELPPWLKHIDQGCSLLISETRYGNTLGIWAGTRDINT